MNIEEYQAELQRYREEIEKLQEKGRDIFENEAKLLFGKHSALHTFGWTQFTPYFNDGDPCSFSVHSYEGDIELNGVSKYSDDEDKDEAWKDIENPTGVIKEIVKILNILDDDCLEWYGEGRIVVERDKKVRCNDIDHD